VVAAGECASKLRIGSTLPFVEMRLRMGPRCTVVVRTRKGDGRVKIGIRASVASTPSASHVRLLRVAGRPFELLLVPANWLSFRPRRGQLQALIYHSDGYEKMPSAPAVAWLDAGGGSRMLARRAFYAAPLGSRTTSYDQSSGCEPISTVRI